MPKYTNYYSLPEPIVSALTQDWYYSPGRISVTGLLKSPRQLQLERRYADRITEDVSDRIWLLLGNAVHDVLERADTENSLQEESLSTEILGWKVAGRADLWEEPGILSDFKITSVWAGINGMKPEHEAQLNMYAQLYRQAGFPVEQVQVVAILRDWSKGRARQGGNYPPCAVQVIPGKLWNPDDVIEFMFERVHLHQRGEKLPDHELWECTPEERWEQPAKYAVMKKGRKSAVRLLDTEDEALAMIRAKGKGHYLEVRPGRSVKCEEYCSVNFACSQHLGQYQEAV
jgi:hypothetical protein